MQGFPLHRAGDWIGWGGLCFGTLLSLPPSLASVQGVLARLVSLLGDHCGGHFVRAYRSSHDSSLEERVSCELVSGNPNFNTPKKFFGGFRDIRAVFRARLGAHRVALSGSEIKGLRIFAPYTRARTRVRPPKSEVFLLPSPEKMPSVRNSRGVAVSKSTLSSNGFVKVHPTRVRWKAKRARRNHNRPRYDLHL